MLVGGRLRNVYSTARHEKLLVALRLSLSCSSVCACNAETISTDSLQSTVELGEVGTVDAMEEFSCPSECEEAEGKGRHEAAGEKASAANLNVLWSGSAGKTPLIQFSADTILGLDSPSDHPYSGAHRLTFKIAGEYKLIRTLFLSHGFSEVSWLNARFNVYWSGTHIQMSEVRGLMPHQRINHFPRSYMITRKDRLCQNISRMQHAKGMKHFNIIPTTFVLPDELPQFQVHYRCKRGTWIVKPVSSSRGRGISIISHSNQVKRDEPVVVSQYIERPLCVNGYKFDLRIYVAVTSFNPLKIYIYEEGMTRFATEQYTGPVQLDNLCMHLTNYSVNKRSSQYVRCDSAGRDDYGSKWSMSALLRHLLEQGVNVAEVMMKVEDVIIKALIAGESHISSACDVFQTHRRNCFELYGFDILLDENLRPWLLEVNLSPALGCDTPFDLRLKSNLVADLMTLVGVPLCNPYTRETPKPPKTSSHSPAWSPQTQRRRSLSMMSPHVLTSEEVAMVRDCCEEYGRRRGFVRVFPSHDSWDLYSSFLESKGRLNLILHQELYPGRIKGSHSPTALSTVIAKRVNFTSTQVPSACDSPEGLTPLERVAVYLRKLENGPKLKPLWDSVCELLWRRDNAVTSGGLELRAEADSTCVSSSLQEPQNHLVSENSILSKMQMERALATYTETSHSTTDRPSDSKPRPPKSRKHLLSRHSMSRVLQRQSGLIRAGSPRPPSHPQTPPPREMSTDRYKYGDRVDKVMETQPPYNSEKYSTDIYFERISRPSSQKSYSKTPRRAQNGGRERREKKEEPRLCGLAKQGAVGREMRERKVGKRRGSESKSHLLRRTLSSQSLQSCNSSDASVNSQSVESTRFNALSVRRPQSATLVSKSRNYVSPYAQPVFTITRKPLTRRPSAPTSRMKHREADSGGTSLCPTICDDEGSISEALHRLTLRKQRTIRNQTQSLLSSARPPKPPTARLAWTSDKTC